MSGLRSKLLLAAIALAAIAAWPAVGMRTAGASRAYVAPVLPDYAYRDSTVTFYEQRVRRNPEDQFSASLLAGQYLQRYRESLDVGDVERAIHQAQRALQLQPQNNAGAYSVLASAYYALHDFDRALRYEEFARKENPNDANAPAQMALLEMERGRYAQAAADLRTARNVRDDAAVWAAQARYEELTGTLEQARSLMRRAAQSSDAVLDNSAESRAWYHFRLGEMAFTGGAIDEAKREEETAIGDFPNFELAYRAMARFCWAARDWKCALQAATRGAGIIPEPETLGYKADAERALGLRAQAAQTQALIVAVERLGNAYRINDRLLAAYYSEHNVHLDDALRIARREAAHRGQEIFAQDTLAWAAAVGGRWNEAYTAIRSATRLHTEDPRLLFHAAVIETHFGACHAARAHLREALALNSQFDPFYAPLARRAFWPCPLHANLPNM
jgi:tetratricopeptide (TPR) repeat protein